MKTKNAVMAGVVTAGMMIAAVSGLAQRPEKDISKGRHPNLAAAQRLCEQAWNRIVDAQKANEFDLGGHAQKAKDLLDEANRELKLAAEASNRNKGR